MLLADASGNHSFSESHLKQDLKRKQECAISKKKTFVSGLVFLHGSH